jgi:hypothetical protein
MVKSPYQNRPSTAFWKTGVSETRPETIEGLWTRKFEIRTDTRVATAGSCFAQHIARFLRQQGCSVIDAEPPPPGLDDDTARSFGYCLYSARYANIYTVRQLLQVAREAFAGEPLADCVWEKDARYYDAYRPSVEPEGLKTPEAVVEHRRRHLSRVRQVLEDADVLVFTMGLTETWIDRENGHVYPTAPGTIAGDFDPAKFAFKNFTFNEVHDDFVALRALLKEHNPGIKFLVTVSPVPLTATASDKHVLSATTYSKSVLRAVAGQLADTFEDVDYFPSYEMIASPFSQAKFYEPNLRAVREEGVRTVMRVFFGRDLPEEKKATESDTPASDPELSRSERRARKLAGALIVDKQARKALRKQERDSDGDGGKKGDVVCEEILLDAFAK